MRAGHTFAGKMNRYSHGCAQRTAQPWHPFSPHGSTQVQQAQALNTLLANILASSAIALSMSSSLARRLGVSEEQPYAISDRSEGLVAMMFDAIDNRHQPLTLERLLQCHH